MNSDISAKTLWDCGGKGGLILGGVTIGFMLLNLLVGLLQIPSCSFSGAPNCSAAYTCFTP